MSDEPLQPATTAILDPELPWNFRRNFFERIKDRLWGYDFFISYHWGTGGTYAVNLAQQLRNHHFDVFLDRAEYAMGEDWKEAGEVALRNTTRLVLIATAAAITHSKPVEREVEIFASRGRHIIPIIFGDQLANLDRQAHSVLRRIKESQLHIREEEASLAVGAADEVIQQLIRTARVIRKRSVRALLTLIPAFLVAAFAAFATVSWIAAIVARGREIDSNARAIAAVTAEAKAEKQRADAESRKAAAEKARANDAIQAARRQRSLRLVDNSRYFFSTKQNDLAMLLSVAGYAEDESFDTREGLRAALGFSPHLVTFLRGHLPKLGNIGVTDVKFSPRGDMIASCGVDGRILLWDARTHKKQPVSFAPQVNDLQALAYSPKGDLIASAGYDGLNIWNAATGEKYAELLGNPFRNSGQFSRGGVSGVCFSADGEQVISAGYDGLLVWDVRQKKRLQTKFEGISDIPSRLAISDDGTFISAIYGNDRRLGIWERSTGKLRCKAANTVTGATCLAFSPFGEYLAYGLQDRTIRRWNVKDDSMHPKILSGHSAGVNCLAFIDKGRGLLSGEMAGTILEWDLRDGSIVDTGFHGHRGVITNIAVSPSNGLIASSGNFDDLLIWSRDPKAQIEQQIPCSPRSSALSVAFSRDGAKMAAGDSGGQVFISDVLTRDSPRQINLHREVKRKTVNGRIVSSAAPLRVESLSFHPTQPILAIGTLDGQIVFFDTNSLNPLERSLTHPGDLRDIVFSDDGGDTLFSAGGGSDGRAGEIVRWDRKSGKEVGNRLKGHKGPVSSIALRNDGRQLVSGAYYDDDVIIWDVAKEAAAGNRIKTPFTSVWDVEFCSNGRQIIAAGMKSFAVIIDVESGAVVQTLRHHDRTIINWVACSSNGERIATGGTRVRQNVTALETGRIDALLLWDVSGASPVAYPVTDGDPRLMKLAITNAGDRLFGASVEAKAICWDTNIERWRARIRDIANRNFTANEWTQFFPDRTYRKLFEGLPVDSSVVERALEDAMGAAARNDHTASREAYRMATRWVVEIPDPALNNKVCWNGCMEGFAEVVLAAGERAVELDPLNGGFRDTRGVARSLSGNLEGAASDFQTFIEWCEANKTLTNLIPQRKTWIESLKRGINPLDRQVMDAIRGQ